MSWLADLVLLIHFGVAAFVTSGFLLIPIGALFGWRWVRLRIFRIVHAGLMIFVALEAAMGMTCPLTLIEANLRGIEAQESFMAYQLSRLLYWDLPINFFFGFYMACLAWVIGLWFCCPPNPKKIEQ